MLPVTLSEIEHARALGLTQKPKTNWPKGAKVQLSRKFARDFCELLSTTTCSLFQLLREHPDLPSFKTLEKWRQRYPWFAQLWNQARKAQAEFLIQKCLDLAKDAQPKTAHVVRVQFDIYRFIASKFSPDIYGDKPAQPQTTVNVGISLTPERLSEIRTKLDSTRTAFHPTAKRLSEDSHTSEVKHANNHN